jgi:hypothetical protein
MLSHISKTLGKRSMDSAATVAPDNEPEKDVFVKKDEIFFAKDVLQRSEELQKLAKQHPTLSDNAEESSRT